MDWRFEILNNREFDRLLYLDTKLVSLELRTSTVDNQYYSMDFIYRLTILSIDIDALINDTIDRDLLINLTRNCKN